MEAGKSGASVNEYQSSEFADQVRSHRGLARDADLLAIHASYESCCGWFR